MLNHRSLFFSLIFMLVLCTHASAQISVTSPTAGGETVASAPDFFHQAWSNQWDNTNDDLDFYTFINDEVGTGFTSLTTANGVLSVVVPGLANTLLPVYSPGQPNSQPTGRTGQIAPIDTSQYYYFVFRVDNKQDFDDEFQIQWFSGTSLITNYRLTSAITIKPGVHTYVIDMRSVTYSEDNGESRSWTDVGSVTGLRLNTGGINASAESPSTHEIDWMMLVGDGSDYTINYTATASGANTQFSLCVDEDSNPFNGVSDKVIEDSTAAGAGTTTVNSREYFPGPHMVCGFLSNDWATLRFDPWDMNKEDDVDLVFNATGTVSGGSLSGTTSASDHRIQLNMHGQTIDTTAYDTLCLEATLSQGGQAGVLYGTGIKDFNVSAGTQTYTVDMTGAWSGDVNFLGLSFGTANTDYSLNWVAVGRGGNCSSSDVIPQISCAPGELTVNTPPTLDILQPDKKGGIAFSQAVLNNPWNMNDSTDVPEVANLEGARIYPNNKIFGRQGDFFCYTSIAGNDDPYHPFLLSSQGASIDTSIYTNLSITLYQDITQTFSDGDTGSLVRVITGDSDLNGQSGLQSSEFFNGNDAFYRSGDEGGWVDMTIDATTMVLEELLHPNANPGDGWKNTLDYIRFDIQEPAVATTACVDRAEIREDDLAVSKFAFTYSANDSDTTSSNVEIDCFRTQTKGATTGGTAVPELTDMTLDSDARISEIDTTGWANGTYYLYCTISDGLNTQTKTTHRLKVDSSRTQDSTAPAMDLDYPINNSTQYKGSGMVVAGWAVDETQLALVTVRDGTDYLTSFVPSSFNKAARTAHPTYVDSSDAGFFETVSISSLSTGDHTINVEACDTSNNCTTESFTVTIADGTNPNQPSPPAEENESPIPAGLGTDLQLDVAVTKSGDLTITLTNADLCAGDIVVKGHLQKNKLSSSKAVTIVTASQDAVTPVRTFTASNIPKMRKKRNKKKPGKFLQKLNFGAFCNGEETPSDTDKFKATKRGAGKKPKPWKKVLKLMANATES